MARLLQPGEHGGLLGTAWKLPPLWAAPAGAQDVLRAAGQRWQMMVRLCKPSGGGTRCNWGRWCSRGPAWAPCSRKAGPGVEQGCPSGAWRFGRPREAPRAGARGVPQVRGCTWWRPGGQRDGRRGGTVPGELPQPRSSSENGPWRELCSAFALGADSRGMGSVTSLAFLQTLSCAGVLSISSPSPSFGRRGGERGGFRAESENTTCAFGEAVGPVRRML